MNDVRSVSVLVPCRNAERYLEATLRSAVEQTLPPVEILVVDDGSTDGSRAIAARFAPTVRIYSNPGRGVSAARNELTRLAVGECLQFLDADDLLEPHALASRTAALDQADADVAISDWARLVEQGGAWNTCRTESGQLPASGEPADLSIFRGFWAPPAAILYRRSICDRIGGWNESLPIIQDARYLLDAARVGGVFVHVPGVGARYRQHATNSVSTTGAASFWNDVLRNSREVEQLWQAEGRLDSLHLAALADAYSHCARVGATEDRQLFRAGWAALNRVGERSPSRFLRAATLLNRVFGYRMASSVLALLCAGQRIGSDRTVRPLPEGGL